jgi:hypothetical protein
MDQNGENDHCDGEINTSIGVTIAVAIFQYLLKIRS